MYETIFNIGDKQKIKSNCKSGLSWGEGVGKRSAEEKP